jgi:small subunit ribosomal protein S1
MEKDGRRISLSIRRAEKDPWAGVGERFPVGSSHEGKVVRLADFGAFVEMEPGVEALAPAREIPPTSADWKEGLEPGSSLSWRVLSVDRKRRRMSVVPDVEGLPTAPVELASGATVDGRVQRIERFGVFVWLAPGQVGLMPAPLSGIPQGTRLDSRFRAGDAVRVQVVDVEQDGARIRLAAEGVDADAIAADGARGSARPPRRSGPSGERGPTSTSSEDAGTFGSSLGDALRAALGTGEGAKDD